MESNVLDPGKGRNMARILRIADVNMGTMPSSQDETLPANFTDKRLQLY